MELIEQYDEIIERNPSEVSYFWKCSLTFQYLLNATSSYICAIFFNTLWYQVCGGHCLFWAEVESIQKTLHSHQANISFIPRSFEWNREKMTVFEHTSYCQSFHFFCILSCLVAVTLLMMFAICSKGGYNRSLYLAPWRMVFPALIASLLMLIVSVYMSSDFYQGYHYFTSNLYKIANQSLSYRNNPFINKYRTNCEALETFTKAYKLNSFSSCQAYLYIQMSLNVIIWTWFGTFLVLIFRILIAADFNLLRVKIYGLPYNSQERDKTLRYIFGSEIRL